MADDNSSQILPLNIVKIYWEVRDMNGQGGWVVNSEDKRVYYREPISTKFGKIENMSIETISYEVLKQFNNKNYINASISMQFSITRLGDETLESENYKCLIICANTLQEHVNLITKGHKYLHVDVLISSDTKFDKVPQEKLGTLRLN